MLNYNPPSFSLDVKIISRVLVINFSLSFFLFELLKMENLF